MIKSMLVNMVSSSQDVQGVVCPGGRPLPGRETTLRIDGPNQHTSGSLRETNCQRQKIPPQTLPAWWYCGLAGRM
jgi:hypothetical protein